MLKMPIKKKKNYILQSTFLARLGSFIFNESSMATFCQHLNNKIYIQ